MCGLHKTIYTTVAHIISSYTYNLLIAYIYSTCPFPFNSDHGCYAYTKDLQAFTNASTRPSPHWRMPRAPQPAPSPLVVPLWQDALQAYPDRPLVQWILEGLQKGFRLGCSHAWHQLRPAKCNIPSSYEHPEVVEA